MIQEQNSQNETQLENNEAPQKPSITLQDLVMVAQLIQICSNRGAFRAEELQEVGGLYNRLISFLEANNAIARPSNTEGQPAETKESENA